MGAMLRIDHDSMSSASVRLATLPVAATMGIGGLPHHNAYQAAAFALDAYDIPTIPTLPRRSHAEAPLAQGFAGVAGVVWTKSGAVVTDHRLIDPTAEVATNLDGDHFEGLRAFLALAAERSLSGPVAWQFAGPISMGVALVRAGVNPELAFEVARVVVRRNLTTISAAVASALPTSSQIVMLNESLADAIMARDFPVCRGHCVDVLSSAMAAVEGVAAVGVHCCHEVDASLLLEAGPHVLSLRVANSVADMVGYIDRFLAGGGRVAWGAVATGGPVGVTANRSLHQLVSLWAELARRGCDPRRLRDQSLLTPQCGLAPFGVTVAERLCHSLRDIGRSARSESTAARLLLDA